MTNFDIVLMNPPYGDQETGTFLDIMFTAQAMSIAGKVVSIFLDKIDSKNRAIKKMFDSRRVKVVELVDSKEFGINSFVKYCGIYVIDDVPSHNSFDLVLDNKTYNTGFDVKDRTTAVNTIKTSDAFAGIVRRFQDLYDSLKKEYGDMCDDRNGIIYEENKKGKGKEKQVKLSRVKEYLSTGEKRFCLYKGSFNNSYNKVNEWEGENPYELFNGQICWLMDSETVKNNVRYWLESPLCDMWRKWHLAGGKASSCFGYSKVPAFDFTISEDEFKRKTDKLNDFTKTEIEELKKFHIHNIENYD